MMKGKRVLNGLVFCIFFMTFAAAAVAADNMFVCDLEGNRIGPKPADTQAKGTVIFNYDEDAQELSYKIMVEKLDHVYMSHLHIGPKNKQGQLAVWLYPPPGVEQENRIIKEEVNGILAEGVIRPGDLKENITFKHLIDLMSQNYAYVNVHTKDYVPGELRGQIKSQDYASRMDSMPPAAGESKNGRIKIN